jgi:hypothetical protein
MHPFGSFIWWGRRNRDVLVVNLQLPMQSVPKLSLLKLLSSVGSEKKNGYLNKKRYYQELVCTPALYRGIWVYRV